MKYFKTSTQTYRNFYSEEDDLWINKSDLYKVIDKLTNDFALNDKVTMKNISWCEIAYLIKKELETK